MALLNKNEFHYITGYQDSFYKEVRQDDAMFMIDSFNDVTGFYLVFKDGICFKDLCKNHPDVIPTYILDKIKKKHLFLVLNNGHEAFHSAVKQIYKYLIIDSGIPAEQIILISESADILDEVVRISTLYNQPQIKVRWARIFECNVRVQTLEMLSRQHPKQKQESITYDKKYICFNRRWRHHRPTLVALLEAHNILDMGYVSLGDSDQSLTWPQFWPQLQYILRNNTELTTLIESSKNRILSLPRLYVDFQDLTINRAPMERESDRFYKETYFSVVTETNYFTSIDYSPIVEPGRFFSEKIFKPVAYCHPFIVASVPRFLEKFRELGYKTFSPWIDESYDIETDDIIRLDKIAKEVKRLSELTPNQVQEFNDNVRDICIYNFGRLLQQQKFVERLN